MFSPSPPTSRGAAPSRPPPFRSRSASGAAVVPGPDTGITYGPTVDDELLPLPVREALARGDGGDIPLLAMSTTHEFIDLSFGLVEEMGGLTAWR